MQRVSVDDPAWRSTFPHPVAPLDDEWFAGLLLRCDEANHWESGTTLTYLRRANKWPAERREPGLIVASSLKFDYLAQWLEVPKHVLIATTYQSELKRCYGCVAPKFKRLLASFVFHLCPACLSQERLLKRVFALPSITCCPKHHVLLAHTCSCGTPLQLFPLESAPYPLPFSCYACGLEWAKLPLLPADPEVVRFERYILSLFEFFLLHGTPEIVERALWFVNDMMNEEQYKKTAFLDKSTMRFFGVVPPLRINKNAYYNLEHKLSRHDILPLDLLVTMLARFNLTPEQILVDADPRPWAIQLVPLLRKAKVSSENYLSQKEEDICKPGASKRKLTERDPMLLVDLELELEPKGDSISPLRWTTKSVFQLEVALSAKGHHIGKSTLRKLLHEQGFTLYANDAKIKGQSHLDRNALFEYISQACQEFERRGNPIISVDCKKKELVGKFKNNGFEWQVEGEEASINVHDFLSLANGEAIPSGLYDWIHSRGFVNVGIDHETAEFAVESIKRWWRQWGKNLYPGKKELLVTADGGGSEGVRNNLWKKQLQELATEEQLTITVVQYPPATSKWNKIEHSLFPFIALNWRETTLVSLGVELELLSRTVSKEGLVVTALKESHMYPTGNKISDEELAALNLVENALYGDWNYTIKPQVL